MGDGSVSTVFGIDAGKNHTYRATLEDGTRVVLKVGTRTPSLFEAETAVVSFVDEATTIPIPRVHGVGREPLGHPYAVFEFVDGDGYESAADVPPATLRTLSREAGANLARLHRIAFPGSAVSVVPTGKSP